MAGNLFDLSSSPADKTQEDHRSQLELAIGPPVEPGRRGFGIYLFYRRVWFVFAYNSLAVLCFRLSDAKQQRIGVFICANI